MKKRMPIEKLLRWAYRDELPKRIAAGGGMVSPGFQFIDLGVRVDQSSGEPGFPMAVGFDPHPDAVLIEAAVHRLGPFAMEWPACKAHLAADCDAMVRDDDFILGAMSFDLTVLIACFSRMGETPSWESDPWRGARKIGPNGKPVVEGIKPNGAYVLGAHCPLNIEPDPREVIADRAQYAAWYEALVMLASDLSNRLAESEPLPPEVPPAPWRDRGPQVRILKNLRRSATSTVVQVNAA